MSTKKAAAIAFRRIARLSLQGSHNGFRATISPTELRHPHNGAYRSGRIRDDGAGRWAAVSEQVRAMSGSFEDQPIVAVLMLRRSCLQGCAYVVRERS
jgi:hypothetical protein